MRTLLATTLVLLSACTSAFTTTTTSPGTATTVEPTPTQAMTLDTADQLAVGAICADIARTRGTPEMRAKLIELSRKTTFTPAEIGNISRGRVIAGMSERAGLCALGGNSITIKSVETTTTTGHFVQEMTFNGTPNIVLTTDNYVVTSVSR